MPPRRRKVTAKVETSPTPSSRQSRSSKRAKTIVEDSDTKPAAPEPPVKSPSKRAPPKSPSTKVKAPVKSNKPAAPEPPVKSPSKRAPPKSPSTKVKAPAKSNKPVVTKSKPKQRKGQEDKDIVELYRVCVEDASKEQNVRIHEERGDVAKVVWPYLVDNCVGQEEVEPPSKNNNTNVWSKACYLLALLVTFPCHEGDFAGQSTTVSPLDFIVPKEDEKEPQYTVLNRILRTLFGISARPESNGEFDKRTVIVRFVTVAWASGKFHKQLLPGIACVELWHAMPERRRELELRLSSGKVRRQFAACEEPNEKNDHLWIVSVVQQILDLVETNTKYGDLFTIAASSTAIRREDKVETEPKGDEDNEEEDLMDEDDEKEESQSIPLSIWNFLHRSFELLIDLLSSVETRIYLVPYLNSIHFGLRCRLAATTRHASEETRLVQQLLGRIQKLIVFPIHDATRTPLSKSDIVSLYHARATVLQKLCHRHYFEKVPEVVYAGVGLICNGSYLKRALGGLSDEEVLDLLHKLRLLDKNDNGTGTEYTRDFALAILIDHGTIPPYPLDQLKSNTLYPTEAILWDHNIIPPGMVTRSTEVLSLPKLNTQFLSPEDYLLRNFELVRLESAYSIRANICDVIRRVKPVLRQSMEEDEDQVYDVHADTQHQSFTTEFSGWARMALEVDLEAGGVKILKVAPPKLGESHPAQVIAEITIDLIHCGQSIRREWDEMREFDSIFLVAVDASQATGEPAPILREKYHRFNLKQKKVERQAERRVPDEEDKNFSARTGITAVRGCMVLQIRDEDGTLLNDPTKRHEGGVQGQGNKRYLRVELDPAQYALDARSARGVGVYDTLNLLMRRRSKEDNSKAVLETIRGLAEGSGSIQKVIPLWLQPVLLGIGDPSSACYTSDTIKQYAMKTAGVNKLDAALDYGDTFLDEEHLRSCFKGSKILVDGRQKLKKGKGTADAGRCNYRVKISESTCDASNGGNSQLVEATSCLFPSSVSGNPVRFTPIQVSAVRSGLSPGLTVIVGPPGTGKTDVAVQIIANLFHSFPSQRTVIVTHSNAALNDLFEKVMARGDIHERYMIRLGAGERDLKTMSTHDFTKTGRVDHSLARRAALLEQVQLLSESLFISSRVDRGASGESSYTCETAEYFNLHHVQKRIKNFERHQAKEATLDVKSKFPFPVYFQTKDTTDEGIITVEKAAEKFTELNDIFAELSEYRPLEMLRSQRQRTDYLLMKQARIVAMTCTHAAIARSQLVDLGFHYDNVIMEEAGQMLEVETFIPLLLQRGESDETASAMSRLKRVCLIGDHHQLPPVVQNISFSKFSNLDQSLFTRMIRLGVPHIELNRQGRAREEIAQLYNWRYNDLGNLEHVVESPVYKAANTGLAHTFQLVNIADYQGKGESTPTAFFYQNLGEAEFAVGLFQYMVLIGYPPEKISILTTYNGQKELISDILGQRCGSGTPLAGIRPGGISTVDKYQGQQNDYIILSLVRTNTVGHLRDVRRLVVAVSRARLGLYVLCRQPVFTRCHELEGTMLQFVRNKPNKLQLVLGEHFPTKRLAQENVAKKKVVEIDDVTHLGSIVHSMQEELLAGGQQL